MDFALQLYRFSGLINFITSSLLGLFILGKTARFSANRIFAYFCFFVGFWSFFYFLWLSTANIFIADFYMRTCMIGVLFMPTTFLHFIYLFLKIKYSKNILKANYLLSILLMFSVYTPLYAKEGNSFLNIPYWLLPGILFHVAIFHFAAIIIYCFYLLWKYFKQASGIFKNQILYVFIGTGLGFFCGSTNYFSWYRIPIPPFLNIAISAYVVIVTFAIVKHRLLDIRLALTRFGIYHNRQRLFSAIFRR